MTLQTLKIGKREFILLSKPDFKRLAAQAQRQTEDNYWTNAALAAEAEARAKNESPLPFDELDREPTGRRSTRKTSRRRAQR